MTQRKNVMLGTAGHVDHGKTALAQALTGCELDTLREEKERGLTIELGFAPCRMHDQRIVGVVDVPGHAGFIRNMVAGAHGIDLVIFVVAADDGVMPQTREHLDILTLVGVRQGLVALTKIDLVDAEMRELAAEDVRQCVRGTFLQDAPICPLSNITGEGFDGFLTTLNQLVDACPERQVGGLFRLWIERSFPIKGFGTVVSGIPTSGQVHVGGRYEVVPGGRTARVRHLEVYGEPAEVGRAGECVALNLADVEHQGLERGRLLAEPGAFAPATLVEAELLLLAAVPGALKDNAEVHLHVGTAEVMADVALLDAKRLEPGEKRMAQLRLAEPLGVAAGDRFVIRAGLAGYAGGQTTTLGGGRIVGTSNLRLRRNRPWTIEMLAARRAALDDPAAWCALHLREANEALGPAALAQRAQLPEAQVREIVEGLMAGGVARDAGAGTMAHRDTVAAAGERLCAVLEVFHAANPVRVGLSEADLLAQAGVGRGVFGLALDALLAEKAVERHGAVLALAGRKALLSNADRALCERLAATLQQAGLAAPSTAELGTTLGVPEKKLAALLQLLADQGDVVRLSDELALHREAMATAKRVALDLFAKQGSFLTMEYRDALGASRKYAVPLLDYFDTQRLTVRAGNRRTPGALAAATPPET